jgi:ABC-2 type transport system permease protein
MTASNGFMERDVKRPNLRIMYSAVSSFPVYFSKSLSSFVFDYVLHAALVAVLFPLLGISFGAQPVYFFLLMAPVEFASVSLGTFFCCVLHTEEAASTLLSLAVSLLCVLGGTFFSLDSLGPAFALITRFSPTKWLNDAFFGLCCDNSHRLFWPVFAGALGLSVLLTAGCRFFFRTEDYL